jgi:hypothetical protein
MPKKLMLCDCAASQPLDPERLQTDAGLSCSRLHTALCTDEIGAAAKAIKSGDAVICCAQEARTFEDLAAELGKDAPACIDLRDRAGWSDDPASKHPMMAALLAEASLPVRPEKTRDVVSEGLCLIIGAADVAVPAAEKLAPILGVTVLLTDAATRPKAAPTTRSAAASCRPKARSAGSTCASTRCNRSIPPGAAPCAGPRRAMAGRPNATSSSTCRAARQCFPHPKSARVTCALIRAA